MRKATATSSEAKALGALLARHEDWKHLRVKARGRSLLIVADEQGDPDPLARLEPIGPGRYGLCIMWHNRKWQRTPAAAGLADVVKILRQDFGPLLDAW